MLEARAARSLRSRKSITDDLKQSARIRRSTIGSPYTVYHYAYYIPCCIQYINKHIHAYKRTHIHTRRIRRAEIRYATAYSTRDYHVASDDRSILGVAVCVGPLDVSRERERENWCRWTRKEGPGCGRVVASELKRNVDREWGAKTKNDRNRTLHEREKRYAEPL